MKVQKLIYMLTLAAGLSFAAAGCSITEQPLPPNNNTLIKSETKWLCDRNSSVKIYKVYHKEFNTDGNLSLFYEYNNMGILSSKSSYKYIDRNTVEQKDIYSNDGTVSDTKQYSYQFNESGKIEKKVTYSDNGAISIIERYNYDDKGNLLKKIESDEFGKIFSEKTYSYSFNPSGNIVERYENLDNSGKYLSKDSLIYVSGEMKIELIRLDDKGLINIKYTYIYDNKGKVVQEYEYLPTGELLKVYKVDYAYYNN